jgi:hypothetical protein
MSDFHFQISSNCKRREMLNSNRNNNNNQNQIPENLINQNEINTTTKVKKILISKNNNHQNSPKRIIQSNRIYNRRVVSPRSYKIINKSPNRTYQAYPTEEAKAETLSNNESNDYMNLYKNNSNGYIYNKEDFNNNNFFQNESQYEYHQEIKRNNYKKIVSYDLIKDKKLFQYDYNYISPKKDSKILLKTVICNPINIKYTEIKDAELKTKKEHIEEFEETEITIRNKVIKIWDSLDQVINECSFALISDELFDKKLMIESYEKKIEELNETISNLLKEKEQNKKRDFSDNIIQSFNFKLKRKSIKKKKESFSIENINEMFIPPKPKFINIKQKINDFIIPKISKEKDDLYLNIEEIQIKKEQLFNLEQKPKIIYELEKANDILIPGKPKEKFTSDKIFGQELMILAKKKKKIYKIEYKDSIQLFQEEEKKLPLEAFFVEEINLLGYEEALKTKFKNKIVKRDKIKLEGKKPEKNKIQKRVSSIEIFPLPKKLKYEEINAFLIPGLIQAENIIEAIDNIYLDSINKPENIIDQSEQLFIEATPKNYNYDIEYIDSISLEEIEKEKNFIIKKSELIIVSEKKCNLLEIDYLEQFNLDGKEIPIFEIERNEEIELIKEKKLYSELNIIERVDEINFYNEKKFNNDSLEIIMGDDIFFDEIQKPENEIQELEGFTLLNIKAFKDIIIESIEVLEIIPEEKPFIDFLIEKKDAFMIEKDISTREKYEYIEEEYKKSKFYNFKKNNDFIPEKFEIVDTANFQIISLGIRELYQQRLQGFSIMRMEREKNEIELNNDLTFYKKNYYYNTKNIQNKNSYYYNKNTNFETFDQIKRKRVFQNNRTYNNYYKNITKRKVNTFRSQNYKTFIAFPKGNVEYIDNIDIFNESQNNNDNYYSDDDISKKKNTQPKNQNNKNEINNTNINNKVKERFKSKILIRNNNNISFNDNNNLNKSFTDRENKYSSKRTIKEYIQLTPKKIENYQNNNEIKALTEQRVYRRKIYRFEEGKNVKIIND